MDERTRIEQAGQGDLAAFEPLVEAHVQEVYETLAVRVPRETALDLTLETFRTAWHGIGLFQFDQSLTEWLRAIARDKLETYFRRHRKTDGQPEGPVPTAEELTRAVMNTLRQEGRQYHPKAVLSRMRFTILALVLALLLLLASRLGLLGGTAKPGAAGEQPAAAPTPPQVSAEFQIVPDGEE